MTIINDNDNELDKEEKGDNIDNGKNNIGIAEALESSSDDEDDAPNIEGVSIINELRRKVDDRPKRFERLSRTLQVVFKFHIFLLGKPSKLKNR